MDQIANLLSISKVLEKNIDKVVYEIFEIYKDKFLIEEIGYIIPAVWGGMKNGELDETQREIHKRTNRLVDDSISALVLENTSAPQLFAIRFLINRTIIYTISYMIEMNRNQLSQGRINARDMLINLKPMGNA